MNRREFLFYIGKFIFDKTVDVKDCEPSEKSKLKEYLKNIDNESKRYEVIVKKYDLFKDFKELTEEQRISDYLMYFPMYKAGEIQNDIPWFLLWIVHIQESAVSRAVYPEINGYRGGMQRHPRFYNDQMSIESARGWEFLKLLPQRYSKDKGYKTNDYEEILFASKKISDDAGGIKNRSPSLSWEQSFLSAQNLYCAEQFANERIDRYFKIKQLFMSSRNTFRNFEQ